MTLGDWAAVKRFLAKLPEAEGKAAYKRLVQALPNAPGPGRGRRPRRCCHPAESRPRRGHGEGRGLGTRDAMPPQLAQFQERNAFTNQDVIALAGAAPHGLDDDLIAGLGQVLRLAMEKGEAIEDFVARLRAEGEQPAKEAALSRRQAAKLLIAAGHAVEAGDFLPTPDEAEAGNDREALNLLSRHYLALHAKEKKAALLEEAWKVTQAVLAVGAVDQEQKDEALTRAVELAPKVRDELGRAWLEQSFTDRPERGMEIIAAIGAAVSKGLQTHPMDADFRKKSLELQKTAVEALLAAAPGTGRRLAAPA